jgi:hypothetical protein
MSPSAHFAFRSCRLPLISPSALGKALLSKTCAMLCLLTFCLLLLMMHPAQAQGFWNVQPCYADGTPLPNPYQDPYGFYPLYGTVGAANV